VENKRKATRGKRRGKALELPERRKISNSSAM
jgi:hypothetical protein